MKTKYLFLVLLFFISILGSFAEGAIQIDPISINSKGDVLCKSFDYFFYEDSLICIDYKWIVITNDLQIKVYDWHNVSSSSSNDFLLEGELDYWAQIYEEDIDFYTPPESLKEIIKEYDFKKYNIDEYKEMKNYSNSNFQQHFTSINTGNLKRYDIKFSLSKNTEIYVKYVFPNFILTHTDSYYDNYIGSLYGNDYFASLILYVDITSEMLSIDSIIPKP